MQKVLFYILYIWLRPASQKKKICSEDVFNLNQLVKKNDALSITTYEKCKKNNF